MKIYLKEPYPRKKHSLFPQIAFICLSVVFQIFVLYVMIVLPPNNKSAIFIPIIYFAVFDILAAFMLKRSLFKEIFEIEITSDQVIFISLVKRHCFYLKKTSNANYKKREMSVILTFDYEEKIIKFYFQKYEKGNNVFSKINIDYDNLNKLISLLNN